MTAKKQKPKLESNYRNSLFNRLVRNTYVPFQEIVEKYYMNRTSLYANKSYRGSKK